MACTLATEVLVQVAVLTETATQNLMLQASQAGKPQQWLVRDVQGNIAHVTAADLGEGGHRVHVIDRVLYSGACNLHAL